jgi:AcrR family transcriptional regulator
MTQRTLRRAVSEEDKQQRRDEILAAAKGVFASKGYHDTTIADVARGAELSYGAVYWYFESKDELFHALMGVEEERLRAAIATAATAGGRREVGEVLRDAVRATFEFFDEDPDSTRLIFREPSSMGSGFERHLFGIFGRFIDDMQALVERAQELGYVRPAPARMVAITCAGLIGQVAMRRLAFDDAMTASEAADFTVDLFLDGLRPRPHDDHPETTSDSANETNVGKAAN